MRRCVLRILRRRDGSNAHRSSALSRASLFSAATSRRLRTSRGDAAPPAGARGSGVGNEQHRRQTDRLRSLPKRGASSPFALALGAGPQAPAGTECRAERSPATRPDRARSSRGRSGEEVPRCDARRFGAPPPGDPFAPSVFTASIVTTRSLGAESPRTKSPRARFLNFCRSPFPDMSGKPRARRVIPSCSRACASSVSPWRSCWSWASSRCAFSRRGDEPVAEAPRSDAPAAQKRAWTPPPAPQARRRLRSLRARRQGCAAEFCDRRCAGGLDDPHFRARAGRDALAGREPRRRLAAGRGGARQSRRHPAEGFRRRA